MIRKADIQNIDPRTFEKLIAHLWKAKGYDVTLRSKSHDRGVDVEATKTGYKEVIQAKRNSSGNIGSQIVRKYATLYQQIPTANAVVIAAAGGFTSEATELADDLNVTLFDGDAITRELNDHDVDVTSIGLSMDTADQVADTVSDDERMAAREAVKDATESLEDFHEIYNDFHEQKDEFTTTGNRPEVNYEINRVKPELKMYLTNVEKQEDVLTKLAGDYATTRFVRLLRTAISLLEEFKQFITWVIESHTYKFDSIAAQNEAREEINIQDKTDEYVEINEEFDPEGFRKAVFG